MWIHIRLTFLYGLLVYHHRTQCRSVTRQKYLQKVVVAKYTAVRIIEISNYLLALAFMRFTKSCLSQKSEEVMR